jgi:hypothetical protein
MMLKPTLFLILACISWLTSEAQTSMVLCDIEPKENQICTTDIPDEQFLQAVLVSNEEGIPDTLWQKTIFPILTSTDFPKHQDVVFEVFEIISAFNGQTYTRDFRFIESREILVDAGTNYCFTSFTLTAPGFYQFKAHLGGYFVAQDMIIADYPPVE